MKKLSYFVALILPIVFIFGMGLVPAFAQVGGSGNGGLGGTGNPPAGNLLENPLKSGTNSIPALLSNILNDIVIPIGAVLCVLAFIFAGFKYVMAQGNPGEIAKANQALLYASIGTVVLLGSWVIAKAICGTIAELGGPACPTNI